jgi:hypothetical protein
MAVNKFEFIIEREGYPDLLDRRYIDFGDNTIYATQEDPYGFWHLSLDKGQLPERYRGSYTTWGDCERAAQIYLRERGERTVERQEPLEMRTEGPVVYKKKFRTEDGKNLPFSEVVKVNP